MDAYYFPHEPSHVIPHGITVSKKPELSDGDLECTEYLWGHVSLTFVDADNFTADEREAAYRAWMTRRVEQRCRKK